MPVEPPVAGLQPPAPRLFKVLKLAQLLPAMSGGGTPAQLVDRVRDGVDDLVVTLPGYTAGRFPAMEVFELPFLTNSAEVAASAAWDYLQKNAQKKTNNLVKECLSTANQFVWL